MNSGTNTGSAMIQIKQVESNLFETVLTKHYRTRERIIHVGTTKRHLLSKTAEELAQTVFSREFNDFRGTMYYCSTKDMSASEKVLFEKCQSYNISLLNKRKKDGSYIESSTSNLPGYVYMIVRGYQPVSKSVDTDSMPLYRHSSSRLPRRSESMILPTSSTDPKNDMVITRYHRPAYIDITKKQVEIQQRKKELANWEDDLESRDHLISYKEKQMKKEKQEYEAKINDMKSTIAALESNLLEEQNKVMNLEKDVKARNDTLLKKSKCISRLETDQVNNLHRIDQLTSFVCGLERDIVKIRMDILQMLTEYPSNYKPGEDGAATLTDDEIKMKPSVHVCSYSKHLITLLPDIETILLEISKESSEGYHC